jgi:hypothetical protein
MSPRSCHDPLTPRVERIKQLVYDLARAQGSGTTSGRPLADAIVQEVTALVRALRRSKR